MSDIIYILLCTNFSSYAPCYLYIIHKIIKIQNYGFDHIDNSVIIQKNIYKGKKMSIVFVSIV